MISRDHTSSVSPLNRGQVTIGRAVTTDAWRAFRERRNPASKAPVDVRLCDVDERTRVLGGDEQQRPRGARGCPSALFPLLQRAN